jgi:hypothetical protein
LGAPLAPGKPLLLINSSDPDVKKAPALCGRGFSLLPAAEQLRLQRLDPASLEVTLNNVTDPELAMNSRINDDNEGIDRKTSRLICDAVGERLQQSLRPETSGRLSSHLQHLMDELRRRDESGNRTMPN